MAAVEDPADFVHIRRSIRLEQYIADHLPSGFQRCRKGFFLADAEILQEFAGLFDGVGRFHMAHGFRIAENRLQVVQVRFAEYAQQEPFGFNMHV